MKHLIHETDGWRVWVQEMATTSGSNLVIIIDEGEGEDAETIDLGSYDEAYHGLYSVDRILARIIAGDPRNTAHPEGEALVLLAKAEALVASLVIHEPESNWTITTDNGDPKKMTHTQTWATDEINARGVAEDYAMHAQAWITLFRDGAPYRRYSPSTAQELPETAEFRAMTIPAH